MGEHSEHRGTIAHQRIDNPGLDRSVGYDKFDVRILDDPTDLLVGIRLVDRYDDAADGLGGKIEDGPFIGGGPKNSHGIAGL